ncbi:MAG TPA: DUF6444 domain-containing protein [Pseudonocardiaceae bacterium]|nr:DUF6444 domain-containing protein [Pseudonocardiaceae bacterium]
MRFDLRVPGPEEMSRDELIVMVRRQAGQITAMAGQLSQLMETNEVLAGKLARPEHLLSRNSGNSSNPPSKDDDPGKPAPPEKNTRDKGRPKRLRGKQPGAPGTHLAWTENPMIVWTGSRGAAASAVMTWVAPGIWEWWIATSNMRSCGSA